MRLEQRTPSVRELLNSGSRDADRSLVSIAAVTRAGDFDRSFLGRHDCAGDRQYACFLRNGQQFGFFASRWKGLDHFVGPSHPNPIAFTKDEVERLFHEANLIQTWKLLQWNVRLFKGHRSSIGQSQAPQPHYSLSRLNLQFLRKLLCRLYDRLL